MLTLADAIQADYARRKQAEAALDYDDLIVKARHLLSRAGAAAWVLYKIDGGVDHILVDEAQDTNPEQWAIIEALAEEFFAGAGARETLRTLFAVGDEKQSIYSFQGANPARFGAVGRAFKRAGDRRRRRVARSAAQPVVPLHGAGARRRGLRVRPAGSGARADLRRERGHQAPREPAGRSGTRRVVGGGG